MEKLDHALLSQVKKGFVAMPGGADPSMGAGPVAGGGPLTQGQASPMGGTPQMDPAMMQGGMPQGDPSMMGGMPQGGDPNAMPPPPPGGDPNAMPAPAPAGGGSPVDVGGQILLSPSEFIAILQAVQGGGGVKPKTPKAAGATGEQPAAGGAPAANGGGTEAKLDRIIKLLSGGQPQ